MTFDRRGRGPQLIGVMAIILGCGCSFAAIRSPTDFAALAIQTCAIAALIVARLGAIFGTPRGFWEGYALGGWACLLPRFARPLNDLDLYAFSPALYAEIDPEGARIHRERFHEFGYVDRAASIFATLGVMLTAAAAGLVGPGIEKWGRRPTPLQDSWLVMGMISSLVLAMAVSAMRFPESLAAVVFALSATVILLTLSVGCFIGRSREFCVGATTGWLALFFLLGDRTIDPFPDAFHRPSDSMEAL